MPKGIYKRKNNARTLRTTSAAVPAPAPPVQRAILVDSDVADTLAIVAALDGRTTGQVIRAMCDRLRKPPAKV